MRFKSTKSNAFIFRPILLFDVLAVCALVPASFGFRSRFG